MPYKNKNDPRAIESARKAQKKFRGKHKEHYRELDRIRSRLPERIEYRKKLVKECKQNRKFSVMAIYSEGQPKCACCGETEISFLSIDHINDDGAKHRRKLFGNRIMGGYDFYGWIIKNNFPTDLQVLCMNCQFGRKFNDGVCPHEWKRA